MNVVREAIPTYRREDIERSISINLARNLPGLKGGYSGSINICGNGPSLRGTFPKDGPIAALNGAWKTLVKNGVMPDLIVCHDPTPNNVEWFKDCPHEPTYLLGSRMVPEVFDLLKNHKVRIWHVDDGPEQVAKCTNRISGAGTIGLYSMNLLAAMGYSHFDLWGYDSCYAFDGAHHASPQEWAITPPSAWNVGDRLFVTNLWMIGQIQEGLKQIEQNRFDYTVKFHDNGMFDACLKEATLEVLYDLDKCPGSWDFLVNMLNAESHRKANGYARIHVHFKPGSDEGFRPNEAIKVSHRNKSRILNNVVRPMLKMFGIEEVDHITNPTPFHYSPKMSVEHFKNTGELAEFHASPKAQQWAEQFHGKFITITLRECDYWPQRNSNVNEWIKFASNIPDRVIFVRDTDRAFDTIEGFDICPRASLDIHKRLALYRKAEMNFFVSNGPAAFGHYSRDVPYRIFFPVAEGYPSNDPTWLKGFLGIDLAGGEQWPWRTEGKQELILGDDTFDNIMKVYNRWRA